MFCMEIAEWYKTESYFCTYIVIITTKFCLFYYLHYVNEIEHFDNVVDTVRRTTVQNVLNLVWNVYAVDKIIILWPRSI